MWAKREDELNNIKLNLFKLPHEHPDQEISLTILQNTNILIEKIISTGQASPKGFWYDQDDDEWVTLLQGEAKILWENGEDRILKPGDWLLIPSHERHRVEWTSKEPPCIWLAVHGQLS